MEIIATQGSKYHVGFHKLPLMTSWLFLANITIILGALKWQKWSFYIHAVIGLTMIGLTLSATLHVLFEVGIGYNPTRRFQILHNTVGLVVVIWLGIQLILGILSRILVYSVHVDPRMVQWIKRAHKVSSYVITGMAKFEYTIIYYRRGKYEEILSFMFFDCICLAIYCWVKFKYPTLSQTIIESQLKQSRDEIVQQDSGRGIGGKVKNYLLGIKEKLFRGELKLPQIKYIPVIYQSERQIIISNYFLFNDYVYALDRIEQIHPGGQQIISLVRQRQVDRFFYGFYPIQIPTGFITHKHSEDALKICGEPIARIQRISPMKNIPDYICVKMTHCKKISVKSTVCLIQLEPTISESQRWVQIKYQGFTHPQQIGQHFSLSLSDSNARTITRLYTAVWCLRPQNIHFMETHFPGSTTNEYHLVVRAEQNDSEMIFEKEEAIPLMIKRQEDGEMTGKLFNHESQNQLILSKPLGGGLKYDTLPSQGKVIMVAGGTGLLPFLDLIDLLYKKVKILEKSNISDRLLKNDTILHEDLIQNREFGLFFACQRIQDAHPLALHQINYLSHSKFIKFKSFLRVKSEENRSLYKHYPNIIFQIQKFNLQLTKQLENRYGICMLYICGPSSMTADLSTILHIHKLSPQFYHFV